MIRIVIIALLTVIAVIGGTITAAYHLAELPVLKVPPLETNIFTNLTILNPGERALRHQTITFEEGKVAKIEKSNRAGRANAVRYALPGLIDMHVHDALYEPDVELYNTLYLMHGVTTVRNLGGDGSVLDLKKRIEYGERIGPRMFGCGVIIDGPLGNWASTNIEDPEEGIELVEELAEQGADCIKVFPNLSGKTFRAIRKTSAEKGLPLVGRMNNQLELEGTALDDVQHLHGILDIVSPNVSADAVSVWTKQWAKGYSKDRLKLAVRMAGIYKSAHTPAVVGIGYQAYKGSKKGPVRALPDLMPKWYREIWGKMYYVQGKSERKAARKALKHLLDAIGKLHKAGVELHAGTDTGVDFTVPGRSLHDELRLMVEAGLSPEEALATATKNAGRALGVEGLGILKEGNPGDMAIFTEDPTKDLDHLDSLEGVVVNGRYYSARSLKLHQRKQVKASREGFYRITSEVLGPLMGFVLGVF